MTEDQKKIKRYVNQLERRLRRHRPARDGGGAARNELGDGARQTARGAPAARRRLSAGDGGRAAGHHLPFPRSGIRFLRVLIARSPFFASRR